MLSQSLMAAEEPHSLASVAADSTPGACVHVCLHLELYRLQMARWLAASIERPALRVQTPLYPDAQTHRKHNHAGTNRQPTTQR